MPHAFSCVSDVNKPASIRSDPARFFPRKAYFQLKIRITGDPIRYLVEPTVDTETYIFPYFYYNVWSYLLWSPVIVKNHRDARTRPLISSVFYVLFLCSVSFCFFFFCVYIDIFIRLMLLFYCFLCCIVLCCCCCFFSHARSFFFSFLFRRRHRPTAPAFGDARRRDQQHQHQTVTAAPAPLRDGDAILLASFVRAAGEVRFMCHGTVRVRGWVGSSPVP